MNTIDNLRSEQSKHFQEKFSVGQSERLLSTMPSQYEVETLSCAKSQEKTPSLIDTQALKLVFFGVDKNTNQPIAIKCTLLSQSQTLDNGGYIRLFTNALEAEAFIQQLKIPGVIPIVDHFSLSSLPDWLVNARPFLIDGEWKAFISIMPRVNSEFFLNQILQKDLLSIERAVTIGNNLAQIIVQQANFPVEYRGKKFPGVHHGDIKPDNIIARDDDTTFLTDFGNCNISQNHNVGALGYCHPDQIKNSTLLPNLKTDTYSFIVTMYQMITGVKLFVKHAQETMPQFVSRRIETRQLPESKVRILKKILEKQGIASEPVLAAFNQGLNPDQGFNTPVAFMKALSYATQR